MVLLGPTDVIRDEQRFDSMFMKELLDSAYQIPLGKTYFYSDHLP